MESKAWEPWFRYRAVSEERGPGIPDHTSFPSEYPDVSLDITGVLIDFHVRGPAYLSFRGPFVGDAVGTGRGWLLRCAVRGERRGCG